MIRSDRQLKAAEKKLNALVAAAETAEPEDSEVLRDFAEELRTEMDDYRRIKDGSETTFQLDSIDDLATALVKARIARGWTQRALAEKLEVSEQMVQRDEAGAYGRARMSRVGDVADILGYSLNGALYPRELSSVPGQSSPTEGYGISVVMDTNIWKSNSEPFFYKYVTVEPSSFFSTTMRDFAAGTVLSSFPCSVAVGGTYRTLWSRDDDAETVSEPQYIAVEGAA